MVLDVEFAGSEIKYRMDSVHGRTQNVGSGTKHPDMAE